MPDFVDERKPTITRKSRSGQNAGPLDLPVGRLNPKENRVFTVLVHIPEASSLKIAEIATQAFLEAEEGSVVKDTETRPAEAVANSWTRNSLRRLVRAGYVEKTARGAYRLTERGRSTSPGATLSAE